MRNNNKQPHYVEAGRPQRASWQLALLINLGNIILYLFGYFRDFLVQIGVEKKKFFEQNRQGYVPLYQGFENFYIRNIYRRLCHGWNNPICTAPGAIIDVMERKSDDYNVTFKLTGKKITAINMGSYNYLGMAENSGPRIEAVKRDIKQYGSSTMSSRCEFGYTRTLKELEEKMANYLNVEAAFVIGMGFATNSNNIPALAFGKGTIILSDELNHASLAVGCKLSGATIKVFKHNDTRDLEDKLRKELIKGQPTTGSRHVPWKKAIIIVEGIFSMEGTICNLPEVIRIKLKYKAYLYLDEAHSIGSLEKSVVNYHRCNPNDIDILMGTFTKSFGAAGGYIAGKKDIVDYLRIYSHSTSYVKTMAAPVARQIIGVIDTIVGDKQQEDFSSEIPEGLKRIAQLRDNTRYFRTRLTDLGFVLAGNYDSPVVPLMVYSSTIVVEFIKAAVKRNVAIVGAGFPATALLEARVRFCLSSAHTREMLDKVIDVIDEIGDELHVKFNKSKY